MSRFIFSPVCTKRVLRMTSLETEASPGVQLCHCYRLEDRAEALDLNTDSPGG